MNPTGDLAGFRQMIPVLRGGFPDLTGSTDDVLAAEGEKVVVRYTMRGTHSGDFMGIPATGKQVR